MTDAADAETPISVQLKLLLWNVWLLPPPLSDRIVRSRAAKISPVLNGYDLVILNEAFAFKETLLLQTRYPHTVVLKRKGIFDVFDSGVMILSKWPLVQTEMEHYKTRARWDRLACKGVIFVRVQVPGGKEVDVYGTHMQAGFSDAEQRSRDEQSRQLVAFIKCHSDMGRAVVVCGDLNMGPARNPDLQSYSTHYASLKDARRRVATYQQLKAGAQLRDVISPGWEQDINRFLIRNIRNAGVEYLEKTKYDERRRLSDSERLVCTIEL